MSACWCMAACRWLPADPLLKGAGAAQAGLQGCRSAYAAAAAHLTGTALSGRPDCCAHPGSCPAAAAPQAIVVVGFPATPLLTTRMRVCISAAHSRADLDYALEVFKSVLDRWAACAAADGHEWCIRSGAI